MVLLYALTVLILVIIAFPIYWLITTSVKVPAETATRRRSSCRPASPSTTTAPPWRPRRCPRVRDSIVVAVASTILTTFLGSLAAYALAKTYLSFAFRQGLLVWILVTRIFRR